MADMDPEICQLMWEGKGKLEEVWGQDTSGKTFAQRVKYKQPEVSLINTEFQRKQAVEPVGGIRCLMCVFFYEIALLPCEMSEKHKDLCV